ncbi:MAG TPA: heavy metal translocating P-type ATPase, partial [Longimicrobiales bacterium]
MDCAECARTVRGAIGNLAGASDVSVNFTTQTLRLTLDEARTPRAALERDLTRLGYPPLRKGGDAGAGAPAPLAPDRAWHRTPKGRFVIVTGALLTVSALLALTFPSLAAWGFTAATLIGVAPLARKAWASARLGRPFTINTLIALAALGAVAIGEAPEGAIVVFLFAIGELLENVATGRARAGIHALAALAPKVALLLEGGRAREVPVAALAVGDLVRVQPGGRVPADGTIVEGSAGIDEAPVTGESMPVTKAPGDTLFAGSIATDAVLSVRVDKPASDSTIARIIHLVEEAEASKAPVARFIDRFSSVYT